MSNADPLDELASLAGIEPHYHDVWGTRHALSAETKRAFLDAMGIAAASEAQIARGLELLWKKPWQRALEPVSILSEGSGERSVGVVVEADASHAATWHIIAEDGTRYGGDIGVQDLSLAEVRTVEGQRLERRLLPVPASLPLGYHRLEVAGGGLPVASRVATLIVAPEQAYLADGLQRSPGLWGFSLQLYGLQGSESWGLGDFSDLCGFGRAAASQGADALGVNPLHALFPGNPAHVSPYSPSSRCFLNPLYIDIAAVPDLAQCPGARAKIEEPAFAAALAALRRPALVDYAGVSTTKLPLLEQLFAAFRLHHLLPGTGRGEAFRRFQREGGTALERYATFEALAEHFRGDKTGHFPWRSWPAAYRDPNSPETTAFARDHAERVTFHQYLQWEADRQLAAAAAVCAQHGMAVGLYRDLALGVDADGAEAWAEQGLIAQGISTGAPPDPFNLKGQSWGLPPFNPHALRDAAYRPFIECLRSNMRQAGALRIDHIMGFTRLFWIPEAMSPAAGGYVRYPLDDLLAITALESQRARCVVIGEDLGTVPEGLRERLGAKRVLSMRVLYFEREGDGAFRPAHAYPERAQVAVGTHDLPTLPGYWHGHDIAMRAALHLLPAPDSDATLRQERAHARAALLTLLRGAGLLPDAATTAADTDIDMEALVDAAYRFLAMSPGRLLMVQLDDVLGIEEQANLPGTVDEHPNWRRKLPLPWQELAAGPRLRRFGEMLTRLRPRAAAPGT